MALPSVAASLAARLAKGYEGETVNIPVADNAVEGAIRVNDRVDVLYTQSGGQTSTLIYGATVIAVDAVSTTYTLALTPAEAVRLAHGKDAGWSLHLVLRSLYDDMTSHAAQTTTAPRKVRVAASRTRRAVSRHRRSGK